MTAARTQRTRARLAMTTAATLALATTIIDPAHAAAAGYIDIQHTEGFFYGDVDEQVLLFAGGTAEDFCTDGEATADGRLFLRDDGSIDVKVDADERDIHLYATPLGGPEFVEQTCAWLFDGDDATTPLQPFAQGEGRSRLRIEVTADGVVNIVNSTVGSATAQDGTTWRVRGWADLSIVDGAPVGTPDEFQGLHVQRTGD